MSTFGSLIRREWAPRICHLNCHCAWSFDLPHEISFRFEFWQNNTLKMVRTANNWNLSRKSMEFSSQKYSKIISDHFIYFWNENFNGFRLFRMAKMQKEIVFSGRTMLRLNVLWWCLMLMCMQCTSLLILILFVLFCELFAGQAYQEGRNRG